MLAAEHFAALNICPPMPLRRRRPDTLPLRSAWARAAGSGVAPNPPSHAGTAFGEIPPLLDLRTFHAQ